GGIRGGGAACLWAAGGFYPALTMRFFNTTGPCNPERHYMLPPKERLQGAQLHRYVRDSLYWMLHAPRQTGKTTFLLSWAKELAARPDVAACYVSVERAQAFPDVARAMPAICEAIIEAAAEQGLPVPAMPGTSPASLLSAMLREWAALAAPRALVVLFDETDVLKGEALITFLRLLRGGFATRGTGVFPTSIALVGMRDLKDYITAAKGGVAPNPGSPFNIKEDSAVIGNFTRENLAQLFAQRTAESGQQIEPAALDYAWEQSRGQPWIVNSLFKRATMRVLDEEDFATVTVGHLRAAREQMTLARETHLDSLNHRMRDPRVRRVLETLLTGEPDPDLVESEGFQLCLDLGLVALERGVPTVANPIYREVLARQISHSTQYALPPREAFRWEKPDGTLDMDSLLREFQDFWRENSEMWEQKSDYTEAFPHLLVMAFLQRVTNGEGRIEREYAAGRGRMDLAVEYNGAWNIIEVKLLRDWQTLEKVRATGMRQILAYRDTLATARRLENGGIPAYLMIFDRRSEGKKLPWEQRITWENAGDGAAGAAVTVVGC
ncbi:MAG: PD-(D/E)XK nuclease domain-containing protein, partial [Opitutaceae bacterium]|nr:PD-(D/E)XK nuclease domain-containing protein [Opitutaceae bacterium]